MDQSAKTLELMAFGGRAVTAANVLAAHWLKAFAWLQVALMKINWERAT